VMRDTGGIGEIRASMADRGKGAHGRWELEAFSPASDSCCLQSR
jgi:hypothetical protein